MSIEPMNVNSFTYYGTATTSSGGTAVASAKLPNFNTVERITITNHNTTDYIAFKSGDSTVTVAFPASDDAATGMAIVPPGSSLAFKKEKSHTNIAADSLVGSALYSISYGNGI